MRYAKIKRIGEPECKKKLQILSSTAGRFKDAFAPASIKGMIKDKCIKEELLDEVYNKRGIRILITDDGDVWIVREVEEDC